MDSKAGGRRGDASPLQPPASCDVLCLLGLRGSKVDCRSHRVERTGAGFNAEDHRTIGSRQSAYRSFGRVTKRAVQVPAPIPIRAGFVAVLAEGSGTPSRLKRRTVHLGDEIMNHSSWPPFLSSTFDPAFTRVWVSGLPVDRGGGLVDSSGRSIGFHQGRAHGGSRRRGRYKLPCG